MLSPTEASIILPKITVTFSDQTIVEISQPRLFGDVPSSVHPYIISKIVPGPNLLRDPKFNTSRFKDWVHHRFACFFPEDRASTPPPSSTVNDDVRQYIRRRLEKIYPAKTPVSLTVFFYRETFAPADFHKMTSSLIGQSTLTFHEGS
jgi:hypothetical protein